MSRFQSNTHHLRACAWLILIGLSLPAWNTKCLADVNTQLFGLVDSAQTRDARHWGATPELLRRTTRLFQALANPDVPDEQLARLAGAMEFALTVLHDDNGRKVRVLSEDDDARRGRGIYAVRLGARLPLAVQAPHGFFDRRTRELATRLFLGCDCLAAAWNTTHRSQVDVAHQQRHEFQSFTDALAADHPLVVVQLHGFDAASRSTQQARQADIIVSNGTQSPQLFTRRLADSLQLAFPDWQVRLFPWSVNELGATTNVQAAALRDSPHDYFVSLELNSEVRRELDGDFQITATLTKALTIAVRQFSKE